MHPQFTQFYFRYKEILDQIQQKIKIYQLEKNQKNKKLQTLTRQQQIDQIKMQHLRKIKKLNDSQVQKQLARSEMVKLKKSQLQPSQNLNSFLDSKTKTDLNADCIFTIKNLDENKIKVIDKQEKVNQILEGIAQLPELQKMLDKVWNDYLSQKEKQQEEFLQACYQGNIQRVRKVLKGNSKYPIDPRTCTTAQGKNGIHLATVSGSYKRSQIIEELVKENVDINGRTFLEKRTPLMLGCILGNQIAVKALLQNKADMTLKDFQGNTALHLACIFNQNDIIQILSDYDPPINVPNTKGLTPSDYLKNMQNLKNSQSDYDPPKKQQKSSGNKMIELISKLNEKQSQVNSLETDFSLVKKPISSTSIQTEKIKNIAIKQAVTMGLSNFRKISLLGRGAFGQVYLVQNSIDKKEYAMKALDKATIMQQNILRYAMTQRKILSTINHPFVVKLHYAFQSQTKLYLVMDYCPGGDMLKLIKQQGTLKEDEVRKYAAQITLALEALHKAEIIYRDLKPGNVIFDKNGHACLTDFGLSKEAALSHSFCGSTAYLAPQMLWRRGHTKVLDWYLFGVLIYECLTGKPPFWDTNKEQLFSNIKSGRYKPLGSEFSKQVKDLIQKLLRSNSNKRLGAEGADEIKKHPWFAGLDWKAVQAKKLSMPKIQQIKGKPVRSQAFDQPFQTPTNEIKGWNYNKDK